MENRGTVNSTLNCGQTYSISHGSYNSSNITVNTLASQTSATATNTKILNGYTGWKDGSKVTGSVAIQSATSFSVSTTGINSIQILWTNPSKGPWSGVYINMSTSGYPGVNGGTRVYTGYGVSGGANYRSFWNVENLQPNTTYYFTCTSYATGIGTGTSYNVTAKTLPFATSLNVAMGDQSFVRSTLGFVRHVPLDGNKVLLVGNYCTTAGYKIKARVITVNNSSISLGTMAELTYAYSGSFGIELIKITDTKVVAVCGDHSASSANCYCRPYLLTISGTNVTITSQNNNYKNTGGGTYSFEGMVPAGIGAFNVLFCKDNGNTGATVPFTINISGAITWGSITFDSLGDNDRYQGWMHDSRTIRGGIGISYNGYGDWPELNSSNGTLKYTSYKDVVPFYTPTFYDGTGYFVYGNGSIYHLSGTTKTATNVTMPTTKLNRGIFMNNSKNRLMTVQINAYNSPYNCTVNLYSINNNTNLTLLYTDTFAFTEGSGYPYIITTSVNKMLICNNTTILILYNF